MEDIVIEFKNITKIYKLYKSDKARFLGMFSSKVPHKEMVANNNLSFQIRRGESVAILGQNGAGKSTLLKIITEVSYPSSGELYVNGRVSALLELTAGFDPEFTGRENIHLKCQLLGLKKDEIKALEQVIIDFAELGDYIDQPVRTYSSGMKARLGFSVSVNINPEIFIIDEALSVGDKKFKNKCRKKVNEIINKDHTTILFVTHSGEMAKEFCRRGMVMEKGKLVFDGTIDEADEYYETNIASK
jgi:teichoic acid transport system ATP-binding protein